MEPLIAPVLDFVCPSSWVSNPEWISRLHSFLLACCDPEVSEISCQGPFQEREREKHPQDATYDTCEFYVHV